jgi:hypothetical protein
MPAPAAAVALRAVQTRRGRRVLLGLLVVGAALTLMQIALFVAIFGPEKTCGKTGEAGDSYKPSKEALSDIPGNYLKLYVEAGKKYGIDWSILAGIGSVETNHGRLDAPGVTSGQNFHGCCAGPMQFHNDYGSGGGTWGEYGVDGNKDGKKDIYDPRDAIPSAGNYMRASGGADNVDKAIFAYNHASWYVSDVKSKAAKYRGAAGGETPTAGAASEPPSSEAGGAGCDAESGKKLAIGSANAEEVLKNKNVIFADPQMESDLKAGRIDARVIGTLDWLGQEHKVYVSSMLRPGDFDSNHSAGRAVDIAMIDEESCTNTAEDSPCGKVAKALGKVEGKMRSDELIFCFDPDGPSDSRGWAAADHCDHVHAGFE